MRTLLTCLLIFCSVAPLMGQNGSYFLSHHSPAAENFDNVCFDMAQDKNGIMYFAMKAGILEFDGREWDYIPGSGAVYALNRNANGEIFWAGAKGFGKIGLDKKGFKKIQYLSDSSVADVFQTLVFQEHVYFLTENKIYYYKNGQSKAQLIISANGQSLFTGIFELFGVVYVQTERNIVFKVENNKLLYVNLNLSGNVIFHSRIDNTYVLGTSDNKLFTCYEDLIMRPVPIGDQPYAIGASIVKDDSPVMEFFIQVVVALLILPVEGFLRNLMLRSLDSSSKFYTFISAVHIPKLPGKKILKKKVEEHAKT